MLKERQKLELPPPQIAPNNQIEIKIACLASILCTLNTGTFLLAYFTDIHITREVLTATITLFPVFLCLKYIRLDFHRYCQFWFTIYLFALIGLMMILRIPYYSLIAVTIFLAFFLKIYLNSERLKRLKHKQEQQLTAFILILIVVMIDDGVIPISYNFVLIPELMIFLFIIGARIIKTYNDIKGLLKGDSIYIYDYSYLTIFMMSLRIDPVLLSVSTILIGKIFGEEVSYYPFIGIFMINLLVSIFFCLFQKEIMLIQFHSVFKKNETCFRTHLRTFSKNQPGLNRKVPHQSFQCALCENIATMVHFDCGHAALCKTCYQKFERKHINFCLFCGQTFQQTAEISLSSRTKRYGYSRTFFVEKKLYPNKYLTIP